MLLEPRSSHLPRIDVSLYLNNPRLVYVDFPPRFLVQ
jgi:hypothetical protein